MANRGSAVLPHRKQVKTTMTTLPRQTQEPDVVEEIIGRVFHGGHKPQLYPPNPRQQQAAEESAEE